MLYYRTVKPCDVRTVQGTASVNTARRRPQYTNSGRLAPVERRRPSLCVWCEMSHDMPVFLTPSLVVEGSIAEVVDCIAGPVITTSLTGERTFTYRSSVYEDDRTDTMQGTLNIYAAYEYNPSTDQLIGWLIIGRIRTRCHLEMRAIAAH